MVDVEKLETFAEADVERYFVSLVLASGLVETFAERVEPTDFNYMRHHMLWRSMCELADAGELVNSISLADRLKQDAALDVVGDEQFQRIVNEAANVTSVGGDALELAEAAARIILDRSARRRALDLASKLTELASERSANEVVEFAQEVLESISQRLDAASSAQTYTGQQLVERYAEILLARASGDAPRSYVMPWAAFSDPVVGIIPPGKLIVVAADTGVGKSIFAEQMAEHAARMGGKAMYISAEMNEEDYLDRAVARWTLIPTAKLRGDNAAIHKAALENFRRLSASWLSGFTYTFAPSAKARDVYAMLKRGIADGYTFFVIDHATALEYTAPRNGTKKDAMDNFVAAVHDLAVEKDVIIVLVSQVTKTENGSRTYGSTVFEHKAALYFMLHVQKEKENKKYTLQSGDGAREFVIKEGDRSPVVRVEVKKNRVSHYIGFVELVLYGLRYHDMDAVARMYVSDERIKAMEESRLARASAELTAMATSA